MIRRFTAQLPTWARSDHPVLRYELARIPRRITRRTRFLRAFGVVVLALVLILGGYLAATGLLQHPPGQNLTESAMAIVFWPTLALQVLLRVGAITMTANTVTEEIRRQTWDNLRATESGAALALRARWASVFYRLRPALTIVLLVRVVLIAGILYDLTAFQGRYLDLLVNGVVPESSPAVAALLLAFLMTASLLLPVTGLGFDAAVGLLFSTLVQQRTYSGLLQILLILLRVGLIVALTIGATRLINGELPPEVMQNWTGWLLIAAFAALGDWGLAFLHLGFYGEIWATLPYGIFLGLALLIYAIIESGLTDWILALAIRQAERKG
jgi:hypothetical protein